MILQIFYHEAFFSFCKNGSKTNLLSTQIMFHHTSEVSIVPLHSVLSCVKVLEKLNISLAEFVRTSNKIVLNPFNRYLTYSLVFFL